MIITFVANSLEMFGFLYSMQCEQTSGNVGCTAQGICGKLPEVCSTNVTCPCDDNFDRP